MGRLSALGQEMRELKNVSYPSRLPSGSDQRGVEACLLWPPLRTFFLVVDVGVA